MTSCKQVTEHIKVKLEPRRVEQMGLGTAFCMYPDGTDSLRDPGCCLRLHVCTLFIISR